MHPFALNKYLRRIIDICFYILFFLNTLIFYYETKIESSSLVYGLMDIPLYLYTILLPFAWLVYSNTRTITLVVLSILMAVISFMRVNFSYLDYIMNYLIIGFFIYINKEKERKNNYSLKLKTDNINDSYNTLLSEYKKNESLEKSLTKKIQEFFRLKQIATTFSYNLTIKELTNKTVEVSEKSIEKGDVYALYLLKNSHTLNLRAHYAQKKFIPILKDSVNDDFNRWIIQQRQPLLISNIEKDYRFNQAQGNFNKNIQSLIASPLKTEDKILGILRIDSTLPETFSMEDLRLLAVITNLSALSIKNAQLFKETKELAIKDGLTSLYVIRHFKELLTALIENSLDQEFVVLMLDLDKFKQINDNYGHLVGDTVLRKVASIFKKECEKDAIISRYGGEEFAIIIPNCSKKKGFKIAERIRKTVEKNAISIRRNQIYITISIGVAIFPEHGKDTDTILENADRALYKSKDSGRNKVSIC